jgi:hypothetical protein
MAGMAKYSLEIKPCAAQELDALDTALCACLDRKIILFYSFIIITHAVFRLGTS